MNPFSCTMTTHITNLELKSKTKEQIWGSRKKGAATSLVFEAGAGLHGLDLGGDSPHAAVGNLVEVQLWRVPDQQLHTHHNRGKK
jgi:hypothetical protein